MHAAGKLTSKGQITLPKRVRDALGLATGDRVVFRIEGARAVLARTPDLLEMAGTVEIPPGREGADWEDVRRAAQRAWARERR
jgi:antitoxin PrlF